MRLPARAREATTPGRLQLVLDEVEPHQLELLGELQPRARGGVRDEAQPVPRVTQGAHRGDRSRDRRAGNVQHTVHVKENCSHGRRVYSLRDRLPLLTLERPGRAARAEELDARRGAVRRRGVDGPDAPPSGDGCSSGSGPSCGPSPRTSGRSSATASSRPSGSSSSCATATKVQRRRQPTKPTVASKERRLDDKKRRGQTKRLRQSTDD